MMCFFAFLIIAKDGFTGNWWLKYFRICLLLCSIIPISMRINLDLAKIYYSWHIQNDPSIPGCIVRNSTIPEELGRIQYLLTDKTGTLTQNDMVFKKIAMEFALFAEDSSNDMKNLLIESLKESQGPYGDFNLITASRLQSPTRIGRKKFRKREQHYVIRDLILALSLCHNVTPVYNNGGKEFQSSSPDEVALVKFAEQMGMILVDRQDDYIKLLNPLGQNEDYDILQCFPFSSETKRMGIIIKHLQSNKIMFYVKGADIAML